MSVFSPNPQTPDLPREPVSTLYPELAGRRVALVGCDPDEGARFNEVLESAGAFCRLSPAAAFQPEACACDLVFVWLRAVEELPGIPETATAPVVAVGSAASVGRGLSRIKTAAADCLFYPCTPAEILTRAALALHHKPVRNKRSPEDRFRILLADDDSSITALLKATLESSGLTCRCTADGLDVLKIAREWNPDLVVLDVNMPGMDGYQVLAALKAANSAAPTPVLLLTGCDQESEVLKGFKLGAEDYVVKPFNPLEVLMRVKRIVTRSA
jgi:CheY-like chemotaxis protein